MKHFARVAILTVTGITLSALVPTVTAAQPCDFGNAVRVATVPDIKLSRVQRESFRTCRSDRAYFGAFYVVEGTDHGFWTREFHDFDIAKAAAKKGC